MWSIPCEISLRWIPQALTDDLVNIGSGTIRQQAITWTNVDPRFRDVVRHH